MRHTINDEMWFFTMPHSDGLVRLVCVVAVDAVVFSAVIAIDTTWDDLCFYMERISCAIWGVVGQYGVLPASAGGAE